MVGHWWRAARLMGVVPERHHHHGGVRQLMIAAHRGIFGLGLLLTIAPRAGWWPRWSSCP